MVRVIHALLFTFLISQLVLAQSFVDDVHFEKRITRLHVLAPGISIENRLVNHTSLVFDFGTGLRFIKLNDNPWQVELYPYATFEHRFYTNLEKRNSVFKRTDRHSGAYGAYRVGGILVEWNDWLIQPGALVGFQRSIAKHGYCNVGIGLGAFITEYETYYGPIGNFELGWILQTLD